MEDAINLLKQGIDNNDKDTPHLSLGDDGSASIVGDPNKINTTTGTYNLTFLYDENSLSEADKQKAVFNKEIGYYQVNVKFYNKRIKPLYKAKIVYLVAIIMQDLGILGTEGYSSETVNENVLGGMIKHIDDLGEIAKMVLGVEKNLLEQADPASLLTFFNQLLENEPNILKESANFLGYQIEGKINSPKPQKN